MPLSYSETSSPSSTTFTVGFAYINTNDIKAAGKNTGDSNWTALTVSNPQVSNGVTTVTVAGATSYDSVRVYRATSSESLVDFQNGSRLSESDLDTAYRQGLFAAQEVLENPVENITSVGPQGPAGADGADGADGAGSSATINNNADNRVITGSDTANTLEGEANLTFNGSLGVGITTPDTSTYFGKVIHVANGSNAGIMFNRTDSTAAKWSIGCNSAANLDFVKENAVKMRVDSSGRVLVNTTSTVTGEGYLQVKGSTNLSAWQVNSNGLVALRFFNSSGSSVGGITVNGSGTVYATSSDYRLKENEVAISDGIARLKQLKPYRFNFKTDVDEDGNPTEIVDGFFAHEVSSVVPEAISGEKDGEEMQGIDQSKLVPLLTSALQEAITKIETLESKVTALEANA